VTRHKTLQILFSVKNQPNAMMTDVLNY